MSDEQGTRLVRAEAIRAATQSFSHPWNPASEVHGTRLGPLTGLRRLAVNLARLPPGKESFVPHRHHVEEEWLYILSGRGTALIGEAEHEVGPGDFMGFPAGSDAHHLRNTGSDDLVYLVGGEVVAVDVADFPAHGKRLVRIGEQAMVVDADALRPWPG